MLLFQKRFHAGLVSGDITLTFRHWSKPQVKPGGRYRVHPIGVVVVDAIEQVRVADITAADAKNAGFADRDEILAYLKPATRGRFGPQSRLFRIKLHYGGDGDYVSTAVDDKLSKDDLAEIGRRLAKFDAKTPWTRETLAIIEKQPQVAASKLAAKLGRDKLEFKVDVRKLKKLGLTQSFEVGYELSPRGKAYWKQAKKRRG